jgi:hypothetical protein
MTNIKTIAQEILAESQRAKVKKTVVKKRSGGTMEVVRVTVPDKYWGSLTYDVEITPGDTPETLVQRLIDAGDVNVDKTRLIKLFKTVLKK